MKSEDKEQLNFSRQIWAKFAEIAKEVFAKYVQISKDNVTLSASDIVKYSDWSSNDPIHCKYLEGSEKLYTIVVNSFKCSFRACDVFWTLAKFEKIAKIKESEKTVFKTGAGIEGKIKAKAMYLKNNKVVCNTRTLYRISPVIAYITEKGKDIFFVFVNSLWIEFSKYMSVVYRDPFRHKKLEDFKKIFADLDFFSWEIAPILYVLRDEINKYFASIADSDTDTASDGSQAATAATHGSDTDTASDGSQTATAATHGSDTTTASDGSQTAPAATHGSDTTTDGSQTGTTTDTPPPMEAVQPPPAIKAAQEPSPMARGAPYIYASMQIFKNEACKNRARAAPWQTF